MTGFGRVSTFIGPDLTFLLGPVSCWRGGGCWGDILDLQRGYSKAKSTFSSVRGVSPWPIMIRAQVFQ